MGIDKAQKEKLINEYRIHDKDTGSSDVQIAILSNRILYLTDHFRSHTKDHHSRRGLLKIVSKRRSLLNYLKVSDRGRYDSIIARLGIRR